jgi:hypothetical protein
LPAGAAITEITASVEAGVVEFVDGEAASMDEAVRSFPDVMPTLPVEALAGLGDFAGDLGLDFGARAIAAFADPTQSEDPNPAELGCETVAYSLDPSTAFTATAETVERRSVVLTADDLSVGADGRRNLVFSTAFIEGAALLWTDDAERDLTGAFATFEFSIVQISSTGQETVVFEAELTLTGEAAGEAGVQRSSTLDATFGGPEVLAGVGGPDTQDVVAALADIGRVHVVLAPSQSVEYAYFATAGEQFTLRAEVRCTSQNLPEGTGAAAVFGRAFSGLGFAMAPFTDQAKAAAIEVVVNRGFRSAQRNGGTNTPALCGALGLESLLLAFAGLCGIRRFGARERL